MTTSQTLGLALAMTFALVAFHATAPRLRELSFLPEPALVSLAGGVAVAYVFLHLLPELAEGNERVGKALGDVVEGTALLDLAIFLVGLAGFVAFYGLERVAARADARSGGSRGTFSVHLGAFALYNALITYSLPLRVRTGIEFAVMFAIAMGLHFVVTDRGLSDHYGDRFDRRARAVLVAALIAGWLAAWVAAPTRTVVVSLLTALLGGSILFNVFKEELPGEGRSRFGWFLTGVVTYSALLTAATAAA